eukprot:6457769-Amphidinium_carterae.4
MASVASAETASSVAGSAGSAQQGGQKTSPSCKTSFKELSRAQADNMSKISQACAGDLELQVMVLAKIEEVTMARQGNSRMKRKKTSDMLVEGQDVAGSPSAEAPYINPEQKLGKNFAKLSCWTKSMLQLLLSYLEPSVFKANPLDSVKTMQQLVEFALELVVIGDGCDKVKTDNKKQAYERLKCLYLRLGSRLRSIVLQDGQVNWAACGFYSLKKTLMSNKVVVTDRVSGRSADIDDLSDKDLPDTLYIEKNWNRQAAHVVLVDKSTLLMVDWFPKRRSLARRLSDEMEVTVNRDEEMGHDDAAVGQSALQPSLPAGAASASIVAGGNIAAAPPSPPAAMEEQARMELQPRDLGAMLSAAAMESQLTHAMDEDI